MNIALAGRRRDSIGCVPRDSFPMSCLKGKKKQKKREKEEDFRRERGAWGDEEMMLFFGRGEER